MIPSKFRVVIVVLALMACRDRPPEPPKIGEVFPNLPLPPEASLVSRSGGSDAIQLTFRSPYKAKDVEAYYRAALTRGGWRLVNDMRDRDGSALLLAEQDGPPLWVRIHSTDDSAATIVELAGAVLSQGKAKKADKPAS